jgi:hypothetical protein
MRGDNKHVEMEKGAKEVNGKGRRERGHMEMEKGAKEVNGKGRREKSEGCTCKRGVDGRKRGRGKCHGLQNLRNGERGERGEWEGAKGKE